jgi:hypothetical protein
VDGPIQVIGPLALRSINVSLAPSSINTTSTGSLEDNMTVRVDSFSKSYTDRSGNTTWRTTFNVSGNVSMSALLKPYALRFKAFGFSLPLDLGLFNGFSFGEFVFDSLYGLRLFNIPFGLPDLNLSGLALKLGFSWPDLFDPISFKNPFLYYALSLPDMPDLPSLDWMGRLVMPGEWGLLSSLSMSDLGISDAFSALLLKLGGVLNIRVSSCMKQPMLSYHLDAYDAN